MTTAEMIAEVKATLAYDLDPVRTLDGSGDPIDLTDARIVLFLNRALEKLGALAMTRATVTLTTSAGVASYDFRGTAFSKRVLRLSSLGDLQRGLIPYEETPATGTPWRFWADERSATIYPTPTESDTYTFPAWVLPTKLTTAATGVECDLPSELHIDACRWAAVDMAYPNATEGPQNARLAAMKAQAEENAARIGRRSIVAAGAAARHAGARYV